jgi:hypothetical protein
MLSILNSLAEYFHMMNEALPKYDGQYFHMTNETLPKYDDHDSIE